MKQITESQQIDIIGDGPMLSELKNLSEDLSQHKVTFHGWLKNGSAAWKSLYQKRRFFIMPSERESFGVVLLEAQSAEMIVVANKIPVFEEILGPNAIFLDEVSERSMACALKKLLEIDELELEQLAQQGNKRALSSYSWSVIASEYERIFFELVGSNEETLYLD